VELIRNAYKLYIIIPLLLLRNMITVLLAVIIAILIYIFWYVRQELFSITEQQSASQIHLGKMNRQMLGAILAAVTPRPEAPKEEATSDQESPQMDRIEEVDDEEEEDEDEEEETENK